MQTVSIIAGLAIAGLLFFAMGCADEALNRRRQNHRTRRAYELSRGIANQRREEPLIEPKEVRRHWHLASLRAQGVPEAKLDEIRHRWGREDHAESVRSNNEGMGYRRRP